MAEHQQASYASSSMKSAGPSMSLAENNKNSTNVGVGNYKGVMLCNRPFAGSVSGPTAPSSSAERSFTCGVVPESIGINVSITNKAKQFPLRPKKETALTKHKKWLVDLQKTKDRLEAQYEEETRRKLELKEKFSDREMSIRQSAKKILHAESESKDSKDQSEAADKPETEAPKLEEKTVAEFKPQSSSSPQKKIAKTQKPAWALTEDAAEAAAEEKEIADADDLIEFAKGLDYDKYIDDMEVQTMLEQVKKRITELERDQVNESNREEEAQQRAIMKKLLEAKEDGPCMNSDEKNTDENSEAYAAAKSLLSEEDDLKAVHSAKSVAVMVQKSKNNDNGSEPKVVNEPLIVRHAETEAVRLDLKKDPSNLPYIHRNPAV